MSNKEMPDKNESKASPDPRASRKALGRGLSALLESRAPAAATGPVSAAAEVVGRQLLSVPIESLERNPRQPRKQFTQESLRELADSIRAHGVLQPLIVTPAGASGRYQLVAGERRLRAAQLAGLDAVPAVVQPARNEQSLEWALVENLQREDLNPIEAANAFERLAQEFALTHEEIAERTGKDRATITNFLRLRKLPQEVQDLVATGRLSTGHAKAILSLTSAEQQRRIATDVVKHDLSVRATERLIQTEVGEQTKKAKPEKRLDPNVRDALRHLERVLGASVHLVGSQRSGRIVIRYNSEQELMRIYDLIVKA